MPEAIHDVAAFEAGEEAEEELKAAGKVVNKECCPCLVIPTNSPFRRAWDAVLITLLIYTATVMPYVLAFYEFHYDGSVEQSQGGKIVARLVDILFWVDLFNGFVFSYQDSKGTEVKCLRKIAVRYFKGYFTLNLIACLPQNFLETIANQLVSDDASATVSRFHRVVRLLRLVRLARLVKLVAFMNNNEIFQQLQETRGIRIINFTISLLWFVHMSACVWYMVGYFEDDHMHTWVGRRTLADGSNLLHASSFEQWLTAMYWVLTVFTSVGFGDISALTETELLFCSAVMLIGAVVNGIIVSEVINTITSIDDLAQEVSARKVLVKQFAVHTHLDNDSVKTLNKWVESAKNFAGTYDRDAVVDLVMGKLPRKLMDSLPPKLFNGELERSSFVVQCRSRTGTLPPRFVLLLGLNVNQSHYDAGEMLYQAGDHPFNIFLVLQGTFSYVLFRRQEEKDHDRPLAPLPDEMEPHHHPVQHAATTSAVEMQKDLRTPLLTPGSQIMGRVGLLFKTEKDKPVQVDMHKDSRGRFPYQLFSHRNYFGDAEVLLGTVRTASARCESQGSCALVLNKNQVKNLTEEFPHFTGSLYEAARHRERQRIYLMNKNTEPWTYRHLAATILQQSVRGAGKKNKAMLSETQQKVGRVITAAQIDGRRKDSEIDRDGGSADDVPRRDAMTPRVGGLSPVRGAFAGGDEDTRAELQRLRDEVTAGNKMMETMVEEMRVLKELVSLKST